MAETEQAKPLAPFSLFQSRSDEEEAASASSPTNFHHQKCIIKCCGCCAALLLILAVTIIVLFFTLLHVQEPVIKMNKITLHLELGNNGLPRNDTNVTLIVDVSVKNPNAASFKFNNGSTIVLYGADNNKVGEGKTPSGVAKARRTVYMNVTVDLILGKIVEVPSFLKDAGSGQLSMNSSTVISGKVKILNIIKKYLVVQVNCSMTYNISSEEIQQHCRPHFL